MDNRNQGCATLQGGWVPGIPEPVRRFAVRQDRVVAAPQLADLGFDPRRARRLVAEGWWQRPYPGVYLTHSGRPPWRSRARAALLYAGTDAALSHQAALFCHGLDTRVPEVVDVVVPRPRDVVPAAGIRIHRPRWYTATPGAGLASGFPVTSPAATFVDLAASIARPDDVVGLLTSVVRRGASLRAIQREVLARGNVKGRALMLELVAEVHTGVESPLELRYRRDVERRHGLPTATVQARTAVGGGWIRTDVWYELARTRVELDGWLGHPGGRTAQDTWRDNQVLVEIGDTTLRYRWSHVAGTPCETTAQVVAAMRARAWTGSPRTCSPTCPVR